MSFDFINNVKNINLDNYFGILLPASWNSLTGCFCIGIGIFLVIFCVNLYKDTAKIEKKVSNIKKKLDAKKGGCNKLEKADRFLNELEKSDPETKRLVCLFRNNLLKRRPKDGGDIIYCNKGQAEDVFNEYNLAKMLFRTRFFTPSALTGLGLLGTFIGLLYGLAISDFNQVFSLNNASSAQPDMSPFLVMIEGAKTAFITSVWGIGASVIANWWIVTLQRKTRESIDALVANIDLNFPPKTSSEFREYVVVEEDSTSVQSCIRKLGQDLSEVFEKSTANMTADIGREIGKYLKEMDDRAADVIAKTLDKLQDRLNEGIAEQIKSVDAASQKFVSSIREATNAVGAKYESIGSVIDGYARSLESNVQEWQEISGGFASYVKVFSDAVEVAHKSSLEDKEKLIVATKIMQNMMDVLQTSQNNVKASMDAVTSISQEIKGNVGTLQGIAKEIKSGMDGIRDFEPKINSSLADVIKTNNEYVEKWAQAYNQTIKLSIENLQTAVKDNNAFVSKWAGAYNETITNSIKQMQSAVSTAVKTQNESVQEWARAYQETVQFSMKELRATIEKLAG